LALAINERNTKEEEAACTEQNLYEISQYSEILFIFYNFLDKNKFYLKKKECIFLIILV